MPLKRADACAGLAGRVVVHVLLQETATQQGEEHGFQFEWTHGQEFFGCLGCRQISDPRQFGGQNLNLKYGHCEEDGSLE